MSKHDESIQEIKYLEVMISGLDDKTTVYIIHQYSQIFYLYYTIFFMLDYFYDSLETLQHLKKPTLKDFVTMTIAIFAIVIVGGLFFVASDAVRGSIYQTFYQMFK